MVLLFRGQHKTNVIVHFVKKPRLILPTFNSILGKTMQMVLIIQIRYVLQWTCELADVFVLFSHSAAIFRYCCMPTARFKGILFHLCECVRWLLVQFIQWKCVFVCKYCYYSSFFFFLHIHRTGTTWKAIAARAACALNGMCVCTTL